MEETKSSTNSHTISNPPTHHTKSDHATILTPLTTASLNETQLAALAKMREKFHGMDGMGMPLDDATFIRYLRAR